MFFTPFNVQLKVGIDLPDTLNASISHDLVTEKFYDDKKCVSIMLLNNAIMFTKELRIIRVLRLPCWFVNKVTVSA